MFKFNKLIMLFLVSFSVSSYMLAYFSAHEYEKACRTLGIPEASSIQEIKKAYRNKAKIVHPDAGGTKESFQQIGSAYEYLNENFGRYSQSPKGTYQGSNAYTANRSYGIDEEIIQAIWRDVRKFDPSMTRAEFERALEKIRSEDPFMYENFLNQYKASRNTSYGSSKSAYSGKTTSSSAYGSGSSYNRSQGNSYSNASYSSNSRSTYNDSRNTTSGFANINNSSSGLNNLTPKKSIFSKIKGRYVVGAASCYGVYKYMNFKKKITRHELKPNNTETIAPVSQAHFFDKLGNIVRYHPLELASTAAIASVLGYFMYQKYIKKSELEREETE